MIICQFLYYANMSNRTINIIFLLNSKSVTVFAKSNIKTILRRCSIRYEIFIVSIQLQCFVEHN